MFLEPKYNKNLIKEFKKHILKGFLMKFHQINLRQIIEDNIYGLTINTNIQIFSDLISAIKCLHTQQIIHGDLKPQNILYSKQNKYILIDFGNSYYLKTNQLQPLGKCSIPTQSLHYRAPQSLNSCLLSASIDIWSLGCIFFQCITELMEQLIIQINILKQQYPNFIISRIKKWVTSIQQQNLFIKPLCNILHYDPNQRWTIKDLQEWIKQLKQVHHQSQ